jgi:hypothetical protein
LFLGSVVVPASVPGQIHLDLEREGVIGDTYVRFNQELNAWVYQDNWQFQLNFTLNPALAVASEIWLVFDGIDTIGTVFLNEPIPPPPSPLDRCFTRMNHTLPNPRLPFIRKLPGSKKSCEQVSLADPLSQGFSMVHASPGSGCWLYHNVSAVSNGTGFQDGDFYVKVTPSPDGCKAVASKGFAVRDQFLRYAFPVGDRMLRTPATPGSAAAGAGGGGGGGGGAKLNQLTVQLESVAGEGPGGIHAEWVGVRKEPSNFGYDWSPITETQGIWLPV